MSDAIPCLTATLSIASIIILFVGCLSKDNFDRYWKTSMFTVFCVFLLGPASIQAVSAKNVAAFTQATSHLEPIPSGALLSADPDATAGLIGPVENGSALGCFKSKASLSRGWIPADFKVHSDLSIAMTPRPRIANGSMSDGAVRYEGDNKAIVEACKAAETATSHAQKGF